MATEVTNLVSISSNLYPNENDHQQFLLIFYSIRKSPISIIMHISDELIREIAEFSTGNWAFCANKSCMESISILQQDLNLDPQSNVDQQDDHFKQIGYKFSLQKWQQSQQYFCGLCMNKAIRLTYCNNSPSDDCCCWNIFHFKPNCKVCECGHIIFDMDALEAANCDCECCLFIKCDKCNKQMCKMCWESKRGYCQGCEYNFYNICEQCTYSEPTHSMLQIEGNYAHQILNEQCIKCYEELSKVRKQCNGCKIECTLRHAIFPNIFYAENDRLPMIIRCNINDCATYVCYACGEGGDTANGIYSKCVECEKIIYPATLCKSHADTMELTCVLCYWELNKSKNDS
eukprot:321336_1